MKSATSSRTPAPASARVPTPIPIAARAPIPAPTSVPMPASASASDDKLTNVSSKVKAVRVAVIGAIQTASNRGVGVTVADLDARASELERQSHQFNPSPKTESTYEKFTNGLKSGAYSLGSGLYGIFTCRCFRKNDRYQSIPDSFDPSKDDQLDDDELGSSSKNRH